MRFTLTLLLVLSMPLAAMAQGKDLLNKAAKGAIDAVLPPGQTAAEGEAAKPATAPKPGDMVENPPFALWSPFAVGTSITTKELVTFSDGSVAAPTVTSKLVSKSADKVTVETVVTADAASKRAGVAEQTKTLTDYPAKVKYADLGTAAEASASVTEGKELVKVKGKEFEAAWVETTSTKDGETIVEKVWTATDIPGGMVKKTTTRKKGSEVIGTSTVELVEYSAKPDAAAAAAKN